MNERTLGGVLRSSGFTVVASAGVLIVAYTLCRRAINLTDEGYLLSQALDMLGGKLLYRDMDSFVTPGIWFLVAGLFKLVEPSVLASRALSFACFAATLFLAFRIVDRVAHRGAAWAAVASLVVASLWAFPAWTMVFYSPFAVLFALAGLERLLAWRAEGRGRDLVLCGCWLGLSVVFKQNYGAFALLGATAALPVLRLEKGETSAIALALAARAAGLIAAGVALAVLPVVAYFAANGSLGALYESLVVHPFVFMGRQDIAFPELSRLWASQPLEGMDFLTYGSFSLSQAPNPFGGDNPLAALLYPTQLLRRLNLLLFWLPLVVAGVGTVLIIRPVDSRRPVDGGLAAILLVACFVFLGVFPRADFNHLMNVYQPVVVAAVVVIQRLLERAQKPTTQRLRLALALACVLPACYVWVAGSWYVHHLGALSSPVGGPRGGVLVSAADQGMIDYQVDTIRQETREGEAVLTIPALAMLNFLADRPMPGRYYNLYEHHIAHDKGMGVVEAAEALGVQLVVSDYNNFFSDRVGLRVYAPKLANYIRGHFVAERDVAGDRFRHLRRREKPVAQFDTIDLVESCKLPEESSSYIKEHLLFASLYQTRDAKKSDAPVETTCTLAVPERAELVVSLGYRRPNLVQPRSVIRGEIRLQTPNGDETLFSETLAVERLDGWGSPPATEYRVDLSRFAGQSIQLQFRAQFRGQVRMGALDVGGYALIWQDPRIETRSAAR